MINKVKLLKNTGKFYNFAATGGDLDWGKNTFLFAPNAYGKTTLVNVLRSLRENESKIIRARKTVSALAPPEAVIIVGGVNHVFEGTKWNTGCPNIQIFDTPFIHANILTHEIEHEHRKNIHKIIIGSQGVKLAQELAGLKDREKSRRRQFEELVAKFRSSGFSFALDDFLHLPSSEKQATLDRIQHLERDIKSKESETQVRALGRPSLLHTPSGDLAAVEAIAGHRAAAAHEEAGRRVQEQINRNIRDSAAAKEFIRQGLDLIEADCPFCGQDLRPAAGLIKAYQEYFDEAFRAYQQRVAQHAEAFSKWNLDNELTALASIHNANTALLKQWEAFTGVVSVPDIAAAVEDHRPNLSGMKAMALAELTRKAKDPNAEIDLAPFGDLLRELAALRLTVQEYNESISAFVTKVTGIVSNLPKSDVESIRAELMKQREIERRFKPEWEQWATDLQKAKSEAEDLFEQRNAKQGELENYTETVFDTHQKRINELLLTLGADFSITDLTGKTDERASEAYSDFAFLILEKKVPLTTRQDDAPCFKNTLSEGDKSALAFAFFIAALETTVELHNQVIIFDDPLSSLDETRREATARMLMGLSPNVNQLCVFTHKKDFLGMLFDKIPDNKVLQIRFDKTNGSQLVAFDLEEDRRGELARVMDEMERYLDEDFGPTPATIQASIRKLIEIILKTKYYRALGSEIKAKKGLAKLLETLFNKSMLDPKLKIPLFNLCNLSNGPHHGDIVDLPERKLSRDELLPLIRETFGLLEKI